VSQPEELLMLLLAQVLNGANELLNHLLAIYYTVLDKNRLSWKTKTGFRQYLTAMTLMMQLSVTSLLPSLFCKIFDLHVSLSDTNAYFIWLSHT
jgi:hypothetical protein